MWKNERIKEKTSEGKFLVPSGTRGFSNLFFGIFSNQPEQTLKTYYNLGIQLKPLIKNSIRQVLVFTIFS